MTPQEYIGVDPYGNTSKMAKIVISETAFLPLAKISQTGNHILSMWMFSNADRTVTLYYGDKNIELNLTTSWQSYEHKMELAVDDGIYLELPAGTYYIWHAQLERATKKSDWVVAPEDVDASVDTKLEKYATLEIMDDKISLVAASTQTYTDNAVDEMGASVDAKLENYATLEVTNNKISTAVTETKTYTDGKANDAVSTAKSYTDQTAKSITSTVEGVDGRLTKMEQDADGFTWTIDETAIVASVNEYYKSTSPTSLSGGSWSTTQPEWTPGIYIWMRSKNTNGKGVSSYTTPVCVTDNVEVGGRNLLSDTNVPSYVKKAAPGNRYLSDSGNASYSVGSFVAVSNLPISEFTHVYQFECTTASSTSTDGRSLCFYSGNSIPMIDGQEYTMSMYARKTSGNGKIQFSIGYSSYLNYNNYIDVTSEWERYSYTFTYSDSATGGTGGARCYFGASCAVVGVVQTFGWKLEKGNKATDWNLSVEDIVYASNEAAKTATNYMKFEDDGLTIGNMTEDTLGRNVLIDLDSVDIRNGTEVLATYGEEIILRNNGIDVFTVKKSTFIQQIKSAGRFLEASSESYNGTASNPTTIKGKFSSVTITSGLLYIWHIKINDRYAIFTAPNTYPLDTLLWASSTPAYLYNSTHLVYIPCSYCDSSSVVDLDITGSVWIDNGSDINGQVKSLPPLAIGTRGGAHIEIDNNEITAKSNDNTPDILYLNTEGGAVTLLNNTQRAMKYQDGKILTRSAEHYNAAEGDVPQYTDWYEVLSMFGDSNFSRIRLGYGTYSKGSGSATDIYGHSNINLYSSSGNVVSNTNFIVPNDSSYFGTNTSGSLRNNFQPCDGSNNCVIGYGSYSAREGETNLYGEVVNIKSNSGTYIDGNEVIIYADDTLDLAPNTCTYTAADFEFANNKGISGTNTSRKTRRNFQPCDGSNNCVIGYGSYSASEGATNIYGKNVSIIANGSITFNPSGTIKAPSRTLTTLWNGALYMGEGHSVSLSDSISNQLNGIVLAWSAYVNNAAQEYWWNYTFIPKEHVSKHYGAAIGVTLTGGHLGYKYVYITSTTITGDADNNKASKVISGVTYEPNYYVLRHVFGV